MKALFISLLTIFTVGANAEDTALAAAQEISNQELLVLRASSPEPFTRSELETLGKKIFSNLREGSSYVKWSQRFIFYLNKTWEGLVARGRILKMNSKMQGNLNIPKHFCHQKCYDLVAVYLPFVDYLLISDTAKNEDLYLWLFHELVHSYQYTYRLPFDFFNILMATQEQNLKIREADIIDFLKYFYESQANYYTLRLGLDAEWIDYGKSGLSLVPVSFLKGLLAAGTGSLSLTIGNSNFNNWIPKIDNKQWGHGVLHTNQHEKLGFNELIILRKVSWFFNPSTNFDLDWHVDYSRAIESAYFGHLPFLLNEDGGDQIIFKNLHDTYYENIILSTTIDSAECQLLLKEVRGSISPMLGWLTTDASSLEKCRPYRNFVYARDSFLKHYLSSDQRFFNAGGEGGNGPGLKISPQFIQPQLIVKPSRD